MDANKVTENKPITKEIDIIALALKILKEWKILMYFAFVGAAIGIVIALSTPKTYTASVVLAPEMNSGGLGLSESLGDLASSFGFDLGSKSSIDALYPELYPEIFSSTDFVMNLFTVLVREKKNNVTKTYKEHIIKDLKMPFWDYPKIWMTKFLKKNNNDGNFSPKDPFKISKADSELCEIIRHAISCLVDKKTSVITISVSDQDPLVAAIMADTLQIRLQEYIIDYRTKKARNDYCYYKKLYLDSKEQYIKARQLYASYSDANQDVALQSFKVKQNDLENEMQLKYNIYTQNATQLQMASAKIQERTPAFTVIEKATMPHKASSTPRSVTVLFFAFLGIVADGVWIGFLRKGQKKCKDIE